MMVHLKRSWGDGSSACGRVGRMSETVLAPALVTCGRCRRIALAAAAREGGAVLQQTWLPVGGDAKQRNAPEKSGMTHTVIPQDCFWSFFAPLGLRPEPQSSLSFGHSASVTARETCK